MNRGKQIHVSWFVSAGLLAVVAGAAASAFASYALWAELEWLVAGICVAAVALVKRSLVGIGLIVAAGLVVGLWRGSTLLQTLVGFDALYGQTVEVHGRVAEDPGLSNSGDVQLRLKDVAVNGSRQSGVVWAHVSDDVVVKRSDDVVISGMITQGFGNIPAAMYRAELVSVRRQDFADVGRDVRDSFARGIRAAIQEPEASLASGFLVGQKTALPEKLDNELRLLGLTHIVVASGYNLSILVRYARRWLSWLSRFSTAALAGFLVFGFVQITGASPSMARASLVTGISLLAWYFGRKIHPIVLLSVSAGVTVLINPSYAWGDIGWLLSFTSFIGVLMLAPLLNAYFWGEKKPGNIRQVVIETMSAQLLTLPIIAYVFGQYSPLSLLANVLILPLIPLAMGLIFVAGVAGLVTSAAAGVFGFPAEVLLRYMTTVVDQLATWPLAAREITFTPTTVAVSYIMLLWLLIFLLRKTRYSFRDYNIVE